MFFMNLPKWVQARLAEDQKLKGRCIAHRLIDLVYKTAPKRILGINQ